MATQARRSTARRSILLGEKMGPPKLLEMKRESVAALSSRPSMGLPAFGTQTKRGSVLSTKGSFHPNHTRGSSICPGGTQIRKDPRPLNEKSYQSRNGKRVQQSLVERGYPRNVSINSFMSKHDFIQCFNFLAELIHPSFAVPGKKLEEEMPAKLKLIGYPFPPPKSCFKAVGTPHTFPLLLGILTWLVDKSCMCDGPMKYLAVDADGFPINPKESTDVASFEMYCHMYKAFIGGGGESSHGFRKCVDMNLRTRDELCSRLRQKKEEMLARITELERKKAMLSVSTKDELDRKLQETVDHKVQMMRHVEELQGQIHQATLQLDQLLAACRDHEKALEMVQDQQKIIEAKIQEQPISAEEAHKLKEQEFQLQYAIAHNEQETKRSYQCVAEFQMCYNRSIQQIDKARQQINDKLRKVTSLMASWSTTMSYPNLSLIDYDSNKRSSYEVIKNLMDQAKSIKGEVDKLYERVSQRINFMENEIITGEETESMLSSELYSHKIQNEELQLEVNRKAKELQMKEESLNEGMRIEANRKQQLTESLDATQKNIQDGKRKMQDIKAKIQDAEKELGAINKMYMEKTASFNELLDACITYIGASREYVNKSRSNIATAIKQL